MALDLVAIRQAIAERLQDVAQLAEADVAAYVEARPSFPIIGVFPAAGDYVDYWGTFGPDGNADVMFELRTAVAYGAVDSQILLDRLLSQGAGQDLSIPDALMADKTLGGVVESCVPLRATTRPLGQENAGMFEAVIPLRIITRKVDATV